MATKKNTRRSLTPLLVYVRRRIHLVAAQRCLSVAGTLASLQHHGLWSSTVEGRYLCTGIALHSRGPLATTMTSDLTKIPTYYLNPCHSPKCFAFCQQFISMELSQPSSISTMSCDLICLLNLSLFLYLSLLPFLAILRVLFYEKIPNEMYDHKKNSGGEMHIPLSHMKTRASV